MTPLDQILQQQRTQALQGGAFALGDNPLQPASGAGQGPGEASAALIEGLLASAGANNAAATQAGVEQAVPAIANSPAIAAVQEAIPAEAPTAQRFGDLSGREKTAKILTILGNALAVGASNDPGRALQNQIAQIAQRNEIAASRTAASRERREERNFSREQFANEVQAQTARDTIQANRREREIKEGRVFDFDAEMQRFFTETGVRREIANEEREANRQERGAIRASEVAERRNARIVDNTMRLASEIGSLGTNAEGRKDPLGRARRIATAIEDGTIEQLSDFDRASFELTLRQRNVSPGEQREALIAAATRLVGKPQPVPDTVARTLADGSPALDENNQPIFDVRRDPATGRVVPKMDALGNVVEVPMSFEEAMTSVAFSTEENEFFENRTPDPAAVQAAEQRQGLIINPSDIKPEFLFDDGKNKGIISLLTEGTDVPEEQIERIEMFLDDMKGRGFGDLPPATKEAIDTFFSEKAKSVERNEKITNGLRQVAQPFSQFAGQMKDVGRKTFELFTDDEK